MSKSELIRYIKQMKNDKIWNLCNQILYNMCKKYPNHNKDNEIIAKSLIIGRVYAAALERGNSEGKKVGDQFYKQSVVQAFKKFSRNKRVVELLKAIVNKRNLMDIVELHDLLVQHIQHLRDRDRVSFASKYLHFHFPKMYFILDSRAKKALPIVEKKLKNEYHLPGDVKAMKLDNKRRFKNTTYLNFILRCRAIRSAISKKSGYKLSIRDFDSLLVRTNFGKKK